MTDGQGRLRDGDYIFKTHEQPFMPGSPATPDHPTLRRVAYLLIGVYLGLVGGFQNGLLIANLTSLQGSLALTPVESGWVTVAYNLTNACMSMLLFKARQQFGIQRFVRVAMACLLLANFVQLFDAGYAMELIARGVSGIAASGLSVLAIFYLMQGLPPKARLVGLLLGIGLAQVALPLARAVSPQLLVGGDIVPLFQLQFALSLVAFGLVNILTLPPGQTVAAFEKLDLLTFPMFASGIALLCAFLVQGRIQWWTTPWLGAALAAAIVLIGMAVLIESNRKNPMLQIGWMTSREIVSFALVAAMVRVLLSEQNFGASGLLATVGMNNDQLTSYYWILTGATFLGMVVSIVRLNPQDLRRPVIGAIAIIAVAALLDTHASTQTRPVNLYWTQAAMAFAAVYFMGGAIMEGLLRALSKGPAYIISFSAVFGLSQTLGGLFGVAALSAYHTLRTKAHLMAIGDSVTLTNPIVAQAVQQRAAAYTGTIGDAALSQASGAGQLVQQASREAAVQAYNDVFLLIGILASLVFAAMFVQWLYNRHHGINPLASELQALQAMMSRSDS